MPNPRSDRFEFIGTGDGPDCTIGELTRFAILEYEDPETGEPWDQGNHSSDQVNPRAGLANLDYVIDAETGPFDGDARGNIFATCEFIAESIGYTDDLL